MLEFGCQQTFHQQKKGTNILVAIGDRYSIYIYCCAAPPASRAETEAFFSHLPAESHLGQGGVLDLSGFGAVLGPRPGNISSFPTLAEKVVLQITLHAQETTMGLGAGNHLLPPLHKKKLGRLYQHD